jgi:hypothetical protein
METKMMEAMWQLYRKRVIPLAATPEQLKQLKMAFYGGASSIFEGILRILTPEAEPTETDIRNMDLLHQELVQFAADAKNGKVSV